MRKLGWILVAVSLALATNVSAQVDTAWVRYGPKSTPICMIVDEVGRASVAFKTSGVDERIELISYAQSGDILWDFIYDSAGNDFPTSIAQDSSGSIYLGGVMDGPGPDNDLDYLLLKISPIGDLTWLVRFNGSANGSDILWAIAHDGGGSTYVTGAAEMRAGNLDFCTMKIGQEGEILWRRTHEGTAAVDDRAFSILIDHSGDVLVTGVSPEAGLHGLDFVTIKYDPDGNKRWETHYGETGDCCTAPQVGLDNQNNIIVSAPAKVDDTYDYSIWKLDSNGTILWQTTYDGPAHWNDFPAAQALSTGGEIYVTGSSVADPNHWEDMLTIALGPEGNIKWTQRVDGTTEYSDFGRTITSASSGLIVAGGYVDHTTRLIAYDSLGAIHWETRNQRPYPLGADPRVLEITADGAVYHAAAANLATVYPAVIAKLISEIVTSIDILPNSCPNIINTGGIDLDYHGIRPGGAAANRPTVPVAILGTKTLDVSRVEPSTIRIAGLSPLSHRLVDVSRPLEARESECECTTIRADGHPDLVLYFDQAHFVSALGPVNDGEVRTIQLTGKTKTGVPLSGSDCVTIKEGPTRISPLASAGEKAESEFAAYPNPFNAATVVSFYLAIESDVRLDVHDVLGRRVATLVDDMMPAGEHQASWDAAGWASGVYFARLSTSAGMMTRKMVLVR